MHIFLNSGIQSLQKYEYLYFSDERKHDIDSEFMKKNHDTDKKGPKKLMCLFNSLVIVQCKKSTLNYSYSSPVFSTGLFTPSYGFRLPSKKALQTLAPS